MTGLTGILSSTNLSLVNESTKLRFRDHTQFKTPEALLVWEQRMLPEDKLLEVCEREYGKKLHTPTPSYIASELVQEFRGYNCVPIRYDTREEKIYVGVIPELQGYIPDIRNTETVRIEVPIYYYVNLYERHFGLPDFLYPLPPADKLRMIIEEAVGLNASDITITNVAEGAEVYYNVRKRKVRSRRVVQREDTEKFAELLSFRAHTPLDDIDNRPRYFSVKLDMHHRGRVVLNRTYYGRAITIRVLSDDVLTSTLEDLNIKPNAAEFIRTHMLSREKGLRLFIGETMSGKNTTILSALRELTLLDKYKIVSVESPVETLVEGVEQINADNDDEFAENAVSLLRQNPDVVYITEITSHTAAATIQTANTGKVVFSTIHANSISDVLSRLMDITGMSSDRLLLSMHSCVYQELVRDEETDTIKPYNRCLYFSDELKMRLYGKSVGEVKTILQEEEGKW